MCDFILVIAEYDYAPTVVGHLKNCAGFDEDQVAVIDIDDKYLNQTLENRIQQWGEGTIGAVIQCSNSTHSRFSPVSILLQHARGIKAEHLLVVLNKASKINLASATSKVITVCIEHDIRFTSQPIKPSDSSFSAFIRNCAPYTYIENRASTSKSLKKSASSAAVMKEELMNLTPRQQRTLDTRHAASLPSLLDPPQSNDGFAQNNLAHSNYGVSASHKRSKNKRELSFDPKSNDSVEVMRYDQVKLVMGSTGSSPGSTTNGETKPWNDRFHLDEAKSHTRCKPRLKDSLKQKGSSTGSIVPKFEKKPLPKRKFQKRCEREALRISRAVDELETMPRTEWRDTLEELRVQPFVLSFPCSISCLIFTF
jgi:hypothetical protein